MLSPQRELMKRLQVGKWSFSGSLESSSSSAIDSQSIWKTDTENFATGTLLIIVPMALDITVK